MLDYHLLLDIPDGVCLSTEDPLVFEKQVIYVGQFNKWNSDGTLDYKFSVDEATIDHWVNTHQQLLEAGLDVPMPEGHTESASARKATALSLSRKPDSKGRTSLFAKLKFKDVECAKAFKDSHVSLYSPPVVKHGDKTFIRPIRHICFTDYPVIGGLDPLTTIAASYDDKGKNMKELATKLGLKVPDGATDSEISAMIASAFAAAKKPAAGPEKKPPMKVAAGTSDPLLVDSAPADPLVVSLARDNRKMKIEHLVLSNKLTSAEGKDLISRWCDAEAISLSTESNQAFESIVSTFSSRAPIVALSGEGTGAQKKKAGESSLVKNAQAMNKRA